MPLPDSFSFSQNNLQDYVDCPRRFFLRHVQKLEWPAIESEPVLEQEQLMELGRQFHLMVQQKFSGIPVESVMNSTRDPELLLWWQEFTRLDLDSLQGQKYCEAFYSIPIANYRLVAKFDLLVVQSNGETLLFDWKTSRHAPKRSNKQMRLQTRVYPFLLAKLAETTPLFPLTNAENIKMIYWYPDPLIASIEFPYSPQQYSKDEQFLVNLVNEISSLPENGFEKTADERKCAYCRFRTLCERGSIAGNIANAEKADLSEENLFALDFDDLAADQ